ncbi:MAG: CsgG/HfaB family protein [Pseudomonadota bacterium]
MIIIKRLKLFLSVLICSLSLISCSTVTQQKTNHISQSEAQISPSLASTSDSKMNPYQGLKRKVAIARFSNETRAGNTFLLNGSEDRIGKQATDILSTRLADTNRFIMLERVDLDKIIREQEFANLKPAQIGADYLIVGSVSEYGRGNTSETGIFSRNKIQSARATVNIRLIDVNNGQIIYTQEGSGEAFTEANTVFGVGKSAGFDASLDDKALSAAISKLVSNVVENLMDKPWQAYLIGQDAGLYMMTGGANQGIKIGDTFTVLQKGSSVKNPQTGLLIELPGKQVATIQVQSFAGSGDNAISFCTLKSGFIKNLDVSTLVVQAPNAAQ